jgi:hypothetical protein
MNVTTLFLDRRNRMLRIGFGKHDGRWFVRADLWCIGIRITRDRRERRRRKPEETSPERW